MSFFTVKNRASAEKTIEKSRFIAYVNRADSREDAEAFIAAVRAEHKNATHNVPAYIIGEKDQMKWASDDGEPQGTSGIPVLNVIAGRNLTNVVMVITRYFGGIKLGTGGLMRAYTGVARDALDAAGICEVTDLLAFTGSISYAQFDRMKRETEKLGCDISDLQYSERVAFTLTAGTEQREAVLRMLSDVTHGALGEENVAVEKIKGMREI